MADDDFGDVAAAAFGGRGFGAGPESYGGLFTGGTSFNAPEDYIPAYTRSDPAPGGGFPESDRAAPAPSSPLSIPSANDFASVAKAALPIAQTGIAGLQAYTGIKGAQQLAQQTKIAERAARTQERVAGQAQAAAQPLTDFSKTELVRAQAGQIDPAIQSQIDLWKQGAKQQALDYLARAGIGDSSTAQSWLAWIDQQAEAMKAEALQAEEALGVQAGGTAGGVLGSAVGAGQSAGNIAANQQGSLQSLIAAANAQLARLAGGAT